MVRQPASKRASPGRAPAALWTAAVMRCCLAACLSHMRCIILSDGLPANFLGMKQPCKALTQLRTQIVHRGTLTSGLPRRSSPARNSAALAGVWWQEGGDELFAAMELELEARAPAHAAPAPPQTRAAAALSWVLSFAVPGLGMFTEVPHPCPPPPPLFFPPRPPGALPGAPAQ